MAQPTKNLPFEYTQRWPEVGPMAVPGMDAQTQNLLNKRDRDLEDYLATIKTGETGGMDAMILIGAGTETVSAGSVTTYNNWGSNRDGLNDEIQSFGTAVGWGYDATAGEVSLPAGYYFVSGFANWNVTAAPVNLWCWADNTADLVGGQEPIMRTEAPFGSTEATTTSPPDRRTEFSSPLMSNADFVVRLKAEHDHATQAYSIAPCGLTIIRFGPVAP